LKTSILPLRPLPLLLRAVGEVSPDRNRNRREGRRGGRGRGADRAPAAWKGAGDPPGVGGRPLGNPAGPHGGHGARSAIRVDARRGHRGCRREGLSRPGSTGSGRAPRPSKSDSWSLWSATQSRLPRSSDRVPISRTFSVRRSQCILVATHVSRAHLALDCPSCVARTLLVPAVGSCGGASATFLHREAGSASSPRPPARPCLERHALVILA
jgi:hypothetical protein